MTNDKNKKIMAAAVIGVVIVLAVALIGIASSVFKDIGQSAKTATLDELLDHVKITEATPVKGSISLNDNSLYDELPDIEKYPLAVTGNGEIDIEIFTSGEKAGTDTDSWLIDCAEIFNDQNNETESGKTISMSIRSVSSGLAADYIISGKYYPDLYTPSNQLFGDYAIAQNGKLEIYNDRLVGNTAGILIKKNSEYENIDDIIAAVKNNELNLGYTNPQTSAAGLNLLIQILKNADPEDMLSDKAANAFAEFNNNIPFIAYTTQQMRDSVQNGTLDGMVTEYQAYINDKNLTSMYNFIPFGVRHDNPLYIVNKSSKSDDELNAIKIVNSYLTSAEAQEIATRYGFNANNDYVSDYSVSGAEVSQSLKIYKDFKDNGKDIIAVFVADCSGSMDGDAINRLKQSLSNGIPYINENNYIGLVSYANNVTIELPIAEFDFNQKSYFQGAVDGLTANGNTSTYEAILTAIKMIEDAKVDYPNAKTMIFLLSDGMANGRYNLDDIEHIMLEAEIPVYTIGYTNQADTDELTKVSNVNEAAFINADSEDIVYKIKSLFNAQL